jgi:hypothetical protein
MEGVEFHLMDGTVIRTAEVVENGRTFAALDGEETDVKLADTSVLRANGELCRAVNIATETGNAYHQITAEQEETIIRNAAETAKNVKVSFTRWVQMVKRNEYPAKATEEEKAVFGACMLSHAVVSRRNHLKRERDAESRRKRAENARATKRSRPTPEPEREPTPEPPIAVGAAAIEMKITGSAAEVVAACAALARGNG